MSTQPEVSLDALMAQHNAQYGDGTVLKGSAMKKDPPRLPTGVFAVDYATGGGLPIHGTTCAWGANSGGKTNLCINAMRMAGELCWRCYRLLEHCDCDEPLPMRSCWLDVEGTLDRDWATFIGADPDKYVVALGDYGEQFVNIADSVLRADDCGLLVIDSLAALVPACEMEGVAEDQAYAPQAHLIGRMVRKLKQRLIRERKRGHPCTVLFTNQLRIKIGQKFGSPETMSGGMGMMHEFSLLLRCVKTALNETDKRKYLDQKRNKASAQRFSFAIRKDKVFTIAGAGEYLRATESVPELQTVKGDIEDYGTIMRYAKEFGIVRKEGSDWRYFAHKAGKLEEIKNLWRKRWSEKIRTQQEIIRRAKNRLNNGGDE